jgi:tetratricopeptide (TPR) repeat protein
MKEEINTILGYLECTGEMSLLQNRILSLSASRPAELQQTIFNLLDTIKHTNIQSHGHVGFYYLFLGCAYYEQDKYQKTEVSLQSAITELWGAQVNKALARWLLGLCYSNLQEFPRARNELQEALQLLASHRGSNSPRTERDNRSRQTIRQNIKNAHERLFNGPLFRDVRPDPAQKDVRFPVQNPPTDENDAPSISLGIPISITNENYPYINSPVTVTNENHPVNKLSFSPPSPDIKVKNVKEERENNIERDYENRTDDEGYLVFHSVPVYKGYARAGKSGEPEPVISTDQFAEYHQVSIEGKLYTIHSLRSKSNRVNVLKEGNWGWIKVKGESMNALIGNVPINDGDYVLFQRNPNADDNDIVIAVHKDSHSTHVKRFRKFEKMLCSESIEKTSGKYAPIDMEENNMEIMGIVYAVAKPIIPQPY